MGIDCCLHCWMICCSLAGLTEIKILDINNCKLCEFNCIENNECIDCYSCQETSSKKNKRLKFRFPGMGLIKTQNITKVVNVMKRDFAKMYQVYQQRGFVPNHKS